LLFSALEFLELKAPGLSLLISELARALSFLPRFVGVLLIEASFPAVDPPLLFSHVAVELPLF